MNMERNRFEYGHIIDQNTFEQTAEEIKREVCEKINFKNGILREINEVQFNNGIILDVRWKKDVHFLILSVKKLQIFCCFQSLHKTESLFTLYIIDYFFCSI